MPPGTRISAKAPSGAGDNAHRVQRKLRERVELQRIRSRLLSELSLPPLGLSERHRTLGASHSMASTLRHYQTAIRNADPRKLITILDRRRVCLGVGGTASPSELLEDLADFLARSEELELDQHIGSDFTLTAQIDAVCASLNARTRLCTLCLSVCSQVGTISQRTDEVETLHGLFWPQQLGACPLDKLVEGVRISPPETVQESGDLPFNVIRHHLTGANLLKSAKDCPFCELIRIAIILDSFRKYGYLLDTPTSDLPGMIVAIRKGKGKESGEFERILEGMRQSTDAIYLRIGETEGRLGAIRVIWQKPTSMVGRDGDRKVVFTKLKVFADEREEQIARFISTRPPLRDSSSAEALNQVREWLECCRVTHQVCKDTISHQLLPADELKNLPSRVVDVGVGESNSAIRLLETGGALQAHWVALSHCWGEKKKHPLKTTRANLSQHLDSISMSSLPRTFRDAVIATRSLGFRYLWIDSLCIIQDDEQDWKSESQKMGTIYEHAILTLAASAAEDSTQGLFYPRPYGKIEYPSIRPPFIARDEQTGRRRTLGNYSVSLGWRQEPFTQHLDPMFSRIYSRGWCTQELILSRRVIHFLEEGMVWVCKRQAVDETGQVLVGANRHSEGDWATEWGKIITEHSMRRFTFESDRLISLDGLAKEISKASNNSCKLEEYFFGNWLVDIPEYTLWGSYRMDRGETAECPSWSWASCDSAIWLRFQDFDNHRPDDGFVRECKVLGVDRATGVLNISAIRIEIMHWDFTPTRRVSTPELNSYSNGLAYRQPLIQGYGVTSADMRVKGWVEFDDERDATKLESPCFYLHLGYATYWRGPKVQYWGLLLERHPTKTGAFKRIGMASLEDIDFSKTPERQEAAIA